MTSVPVLGDELWVYSLLEERRKKAMDIISERRYNSYCSKKEKSSKKRAS